MSGVEDYVGAEKNRLLGRIGKHVKFSYPEISKKVVGKLKDRYVLHTQSFTGVTDYWDVIDLIELEHNGKKIEAIRFGYYRRTKEGKLIWGSQTTLTENIETLKTLFKECAKEKSWFKKLLLNALQT